MPDRPDLEDVAEARAARRKHVVGTPPPAEPPPPEPYAGLIARRADGSQVAIPHPSEAGKVLTSKSAGEPDWEAPAPSAGSGGFATAEAPGAAPFSGVMVPTPIQPTGSPFNYTNTGTDRLIVFIGNDGTGVSVAYNPVGGALSTGILGLVPWQLAPGDNLVVTYTTPPTIFNETGGALTAGGSKALRSVTSGYGLTAFGHRAMESATKAYTSTAVGNLALASLRESGGCVAVGHNALTLFTGTDGSIDNVALGNNTLSLLLAGSGNVAVGNSALRNATGGDHSVAVGYNALRSSTTASDNTAVGYNAAGANTTGLNINAFGAQALSSNTTGNNNVAAGNSALRGVTDAAFNVGIGISAGYGPGGLTANATVHGANNTFIGYQSGASDATDPSNTTALGYRALVSGAGAVAVGSGAQAKAAGAIALGQGTVVTVANQFAIGARHMRFDKIVDPGAAGANAGRLYLRDDGTGKMQIAAQMPTGGPIPVVTEGGAVQEVVTVSMPVGGSLPIDAFGASSSVGTWAPYANSSVPTWANEATRAQNDAITYVLAVPAGTYTLSLVQLKSTVSGIATIKRDGVTIGTIDGYAAVGTYARDDIAGVALNGVHTLELTLATKNASATAYGLRLNKLLLRRTA